MPGWSPEIANEFIRLAADDNSRLDAMKLQKLVYIAHGWRLAQSGEPLTGDRPEAWIIGPVYRRLFDALTAYGIEGVTAEIPASTWLGGLSGEAEEVLDPAEMEVVQLAYRSFAGLEAAKLSAITQGARAPWVDVFAEGAGAFRDIPHHLIMMQFLAYTNQAPQPRSDRTGDAEAGRRARRPGD